MTRRAGVVVLVGPMGVGKTTIGRKLAKQLDKDFIDTDASIVAKHGEISKIFADMGEAHFRHLEEVALSEALRTPAVVATGGGVVLSEKNRKRLKRSTVVYLATDGRHIKSRLKHGTRPLLAAGNDWSDIYELRKPLYRQIATITVDTSSKPLKSIVAEIITALES